MPTPFTFSVKLNTGEKVTVNTTRPSSTDDPEWGKYVAGDMDAGVNELAHQNRIIKVQAPCRKGKNQVEAQSIHDRYTWGAKGGGVVAPTLSDEAKDEGEFTDAQLEILAAAGMRI